MGDRMNQDENNSSSASSRECSPIPPKSPPAAFAATTHHFASPPPPKQLPPPVLLQRPRLISSSASASATVAAINNNNSMGPAAATTTYGEQMKLTNVAGPGSRYVKLNVGGSLHYTTIATLTKHDSMLRAMFSGRLEVLTDGEGWILIDRCGKHFPVILNFLRDGVVALPESRREIMEIQAEAKYFCLQSLIDLCQAWLDATSKSDVDLPVCKIPIITTAKEEKALLQSTTRPVIKLLLNRHNNKYSYTSQSDDNLLKNLELFDKLIMKFHERVLYIKDVGAANEVCSWTFFGHGRKVAEVCCTSIVYATDKKHTKVEFPEARILEEAMNILLFEPEPVCTSCFSFCGGVNGASNAGDECASASGYCSDRGERSCHQKRQPTTARAAEI